MRQPTHALLAQHASGDKDQRADPRWPWSYTGPPERKSGGAEYPVPPRRRAARARRCTRARRGPATPGESSSTSANSESGPRRAASAGSVVRLRTQRLLLSRRHGSGRGRCRTGYPPGRSGGPDRRRHETRRDRSFVGEAATGRASHRDPHAWFSRMAVLPAIARLAAASRLTRARAPSWPLPRDAAIIGAGWGWLPPLQHECSSWRIARRRRRCCSTPSALERVALPVLSRCSCRGPTGIPTPTRPC